MYRYIHVKAFIRSMSAPCYEFLSLFIIIILHVLSICTQFVVFLVFINDEIVRGLLL